MESVFEFGTTARHGDIIDFLSFYTFNLARKKELRKFSESSSLVYYDGIRDIHSCVLINLLDICDTSVFLSNTLDHLNSVTPDYMYFKNNSYLINKMETRIAGCPDLVVEIWTDSNSPKDKYFKKYLYSTSPTTEHWYIEQDSNIIECWYGNTRLKDKNLSEILVSVDGIEFDLRELNL